MKLKKLVSLVMSVALLLSTPMLVVSADEGGSGMALDSAWEVENSTPDNLIVNDDGSVTIRTEGGAINDGTGMKNILYYPLPNKTNYVFTVKVKGNFTANFHGVHLGIASGKNRQNAVAAMRRYHGFLSGDYGTSQLFGMMQSSGSPTEFYKGDTTIGNEFYLRMQKNAGKITGYYATTYSANVADWNQIIDTSKATNIDSVDKGSALADPENIYLMLAAANGGGSAPTELTFSDLKVDGASIPLGVDFKIALSDKIVAAEALVEAEYTTSSWAALQAAVDAGKIVLADGGATQQEVEDAFEAIEGAIAALVVIPDMVLDNGWEVENSTPGNLIINGDGSVTIKTEGGAINDVTGMNNILYYPLPNKTDYVFTVKVNGSFTDNFHGVHLGIASDKNLQNAVAVMRRYHGYLSGTYGTSQLFGMMQSSGSPTEFYKGDATISNEFYLRMQKSAGKITGYYATTYSENVADWEQIIDTTQTPNAENFDKGAALTDPENIYLILAAANGGGNTSTQITFSDLRVAGEPVLIGVEFMGDLKTAIASAEALVEADYTTASWADLVTALEAGKIIVAGGEATHQEIEDATTAINDALAALVEVSKEDKSFLITIVETANVIQKGSYTDESWNELKAALAKADVVIKDEVATKEAIDKALEDLIFALAGLGEAEVATVDKAGLQTVYDIYKAVKNQNYTDASWNNYQSALTEATAVLANKNATTAQVNSAIDKLIKASIALTKKAPGIVKGKVYTVKNIKYKVLSATKGKETVSVTGASKKTIKTVTIPATVKINGVTCKVVEVGAKAFKNYKKLNKITIGANVKKIGKEAFSGCKKLKNITIKSKVLTKVGSKAFKNIHAKATIKVPKAQKSAYTKLLKKKGQKSTVKIK